MKPTKPRMFQTGDLVVARAFTDHRGVFHPESTALVVMTVSTVDPTCPHYRLAAGTPGNGYFEAAESAFRHLIPQIGVNDSHRDISQSE